MNLTRLAEVSFHFHHPIDRRACMKIASLIAFAASAAAFVKKLAPVLAVLAVLCGKLSVGDFTGLPELLSALVAAAAAVHSGAKVAQLRAAIGVPAAKA